MRFSGTFSSSKTPSMVIELVKRISHPEEGAINSAPSSVSGGRFQQIRTTMASSGALSKQDLEAGRGATWLNTYIWTGYRMALSLLWADDRLPEL